MRPFLLSMPIKALNTCARFCLCIYASMLVNPVVQAQEPEVETQTSAASASTQSSASSSETPLYPSRTMRDKTLIAKAAGEQTQWLDTEYGKLLAFYRPTEAKKTRGVLILFHAAEDPQTWPPILENLRANLPRYGWETLAVTLPQRYPTPVPARPSSSSASSAAAVATEATPATATTPDPTAVSASSAASSEVASSSSRAPAIARDTLIQAYVEATLKFLQEKGQFNAILLVDNSSANPVLAQLLPQIKENPSDPSTIDGPIQALVITNLQNQEPLTSNQLSAVFANQQLPVMDVFFSPETPELTRARDLHRAIAMRQKLENYQQSLLEEQPKIVETDPRSFLAARVRGFMQRHASGTEIKGNGENTAQQTPP